ncbi:Methylenetetrahydrofolate reductase (NAD(P)H) [Cellulomonas flavigena DSM 20109]|uniref:Methylenetetrahydrofolate reductase n=1 Tax=Cellulomonas flavigena (strain ATCC 482 / DSM 20109 / BCRC 11376 / JCM 18109 / NBRC 3775 / NCIMB 8073 / NRS 134) TaxID=446466 RepID=D5UFR7_CELFN|nr:methylenetetrahydrofolate reductase [Cellulomonas flavigena]ADG73026.1 Methylenetetrahydrofolate reductase (NAD(P)H) [Cellulomonas flavigena DSM 20109]
MSVVAETGTVPAAPSAPGRARAARRRAEQAGALDRPTVSFEFFPPRNPDAAPRLWETVRAVETVEPDFVSVTYGASGKTRETTRAFVRRLLRETSLNPIAHLTCVGTSRTEVSTIVEEFLDEGVRSFLALRGDPPVGQPDWRPHPEGVHTAAELVELLRDLEQRRCGRSPAQAVRARVRPLSVAVAAFPRGNHATGGTRAQDVQALLAKQEAGADFAISQLFYDAEAYLGLVAEARQAGVTIPIVPGIIPTTDPARLLRVQELSGVPVPRHLLDLLGSTDDPVERHRRGTQAGVDLVNAVLDGGAPGVHVYTFNKHEAALDLLDGADLLDGRRCAVTPHDPSGGTPAGATATTPRGNLS